MKGKFERGLVNFGAAAATGLVSAALLYGHAGASRSAGSQAAITSQIQEANQPPRPLALNGTWKLNASESDDPIEKMKGSGDLDVPDQGGSVPFGNQSAAPNGGRRGGASAGRLGAAGPLGGPISIGVNGKDQEKMMKLLRPATSLIVDEKDAEFDLTDEQGGKRAFFTDGRKLQKSKDDSNQEMAAVWSEGRLTFDEKGPRGEKISHTFQMAKNGQQLTETIQVDYSRVYSPVMIRYVYDPVPSSK